MLGGCKQDNDSVGNEKINEVSIFQHDSLIQVERQTDEMNTVEDKKTVVQPNAEYRHFFYNVLGIAIEMAIS